MTRDEAAAFFAEVRRDPILHYTTHGHLQAWVLGYLEATKANGADRPSYDEAYALAVETLKIEQAQAFIAFAEMVHRLAPLSDSII